MLNFAAGQRSCRVRSADQDLALSLFLSLSLSVRLPSALHCLSVFVMTPLGSLCIQQFQSQQQLENFTPLVFSS